MELQVQRKWYTERSTSGELWLAGARLCYTLEDKRRWDGTKIAGRTCIDPGTYPLVIDFSSRFRKYMPHVLDVPNFAGIRIHSGNTDADTEGCILLGLERGLDCVLSSRIAFAALWSVLARPTGTVDKEGLTIWEIKEPSTISIIDNRPLAPDVTWHISM